MTQDRSLSFLIYAFYAVFLWCTYFGFTRIYFNFLEDWLDVSSSGDFVLIFMDYGRAATLLFLAVIGFFVTRYFSLKLTKAQSISLDSPSRLWMLRLILLASSLSAISDIYILLSSFMIGKGTVIDLYKALVTLAVAIGIVIFSLGELRLKTMTSIPLFSLYSSLFLVLALGTFGGAFYKAPPWVMRLVREDLNQFEKIENIAQQINRFYTSHQQVPEKLADLEEYMAAEELINPATGERFEYTALNKKTYEICGVFKTDSSQAPHRFQHSGIGLGKASYQKERSCFQQQAHKDKSSPDWTHD